MWLIRGSQDPFSNLAKLSYQATFSLVALILHLEDDVVNI